MTTDEYAPGLDDSELDEPEIRSPEVAATVVSTVAPLDSRLAAIDALPLDQRAVAYVQLHDEMRDRLEGGDAPQTQG